jgi:hypothetical protein
VVDGEVAVGHAHERFDAVGTLVDMNLNDELREVVETLLEETRPRVAVAA